MFSVVGIALQMLEAESRMERGLKNAGRQRKVYF